MLVFTVVSCGADEPLGAPGFTAATSTAILESSEDAESEASDSPAPGPEATLMLTHHRTDGNRVVDAAGTFPNVRTVDIELGDIPAWLAAAMLGAGRTDSVLRVWFP